MKKEAKLVVLAISLILAFTLIFFLVNKSQEELAENSNDAGLIDINDETGSGEDLFVVSGVFTCLPVKDENVPHYDLCVHGIKDGDNYYALKSPSEDQNNSISRIKEGQRIEISGNLEEEESDMYQTLGTISVLSLKYLETDYDAVKRYLPESFKADYVSFSYYNLGEYLISDYPALESWVENGEIECNETSSWSSQSLQVRQRELGDRKYCVAYTNQSSAGPLYTEYSYSTVIGDKVYVIGFLAKFDRCGDLGQEELARCHAEREVFDMDKLVDEEIKKVIN